MNKSFILILLSFLLFFNCKKSPTSLSPKEEKIKNDTIISNISSSCNENIQSNIYNYLLCSSWAKLNEADIKYILHFAKENRSSEIINTIEPEMPAWVNSDVKINNIDYQLQVNAMSYLYLTDKKSKTRKLLTFDVKDVPAIEKYFVRKLTEDDDENYEYKLSKVKNDLKKVKMDISKWAGIYSFDNNNYDQLYKKYTLNVSSNGIYLYEGELPGCKIYCTPYTIDDKIYFYYDADKTICSNFDTSLIDNLQNGDLILKAYGKDGKKYIQSPIIPYWDDKSLDFKKNTPIGINK
ncbi:hypothetical protein [Chryseobacterium herbae]|uniref:Lipoprotein n=1 Tax=Chryseobacterium herbae TaxID=2976476 RepID=A0ABT2IQ10_9FLAO|nr:hypothetical protein [Chryseobacterium sp. pc1-10]MCT2560901.1 hypothetical protein [Chryseobacterium sp. pc1-10]